MARLFLGATIQRYNRALALLLLLPLAGCSIGSLAGTSAISLPCGTGGSVSYSAGLIPQMQPVTATCTVGNPPVTQSASITPGIDIATIAALVKQNMAMHGEILKAQ